MPSSHDDEPPEGTYTMLDLEAMEAAGDIELAMPGTPEAEAAREAMVDELDAYDAELVAREGPDAMTSDRQLRQAALAAEQDPRTIAHAVPTARRQLGYDRAGLASWLGIDADQLAALALEPRPDPSAPTFEDQVRRLAARFGAESVTVKAAKPEPPIPLPVEQVSVEVWREE